MEITTGLDGSKQTLSRGYLSYHEKAPVRKLRGKVDEFLSRPWRRTATGKTYVSRRAGSIARSTCLSYTAALRTK